MEPGFLERRSIRLSFAKTMVDMLDDAVYRRKVSLVQSEFKMKEKAKIHVYAVVTYFECGETRIEKLFTTRKAAQRYISRMPLGLLEYVYVLRFPIQGSEKLGKTKDGVIVGGFHTE